MCQRCPEYVSLHNHTFYSKFDGLSRIDQLVDRAAALNQRALAITDHGNVGGSIKFVQACRKSNIKPIIGEEFYLARDHTKKSKDDQPDGRRGNRHILIVAKNQEGYRNLCRLSQKSFLEGEYHDPRIDFDLLYKHRNGLIVSSACLSSVINNNLLHDRFEQARKAATLLKDMFEEDFFLEIMYHGLEAERLIAPDIIRLSQQLDIPVIATNDVHYTLKEHASTQELLMAISMGRCVKDPKKISFPYKEFYLKSAEEMYQIFGSHPEFLTNTVALSERVEDFLEVSGGFRLPNFNLDDARKYLSDRGKPAPKATDPFGFIEELAFNGCKELGWTDEHHIKKVKSEIQDIHIAWESNHMDFATYFLIVWDYVNWANDHDILTGGGRGSGYASYLLRALGITYGPDPALFPSLLWERFLGFADRHFLNDDDFGLDDNSMDNLIEPSKASDDVLDPEENVEEEFDMSGSQRY